MKLEKIEKYSLELTREELLFLFEVIDKMKLDDSSSPQAFELMARFKSFREQELECPAPLVLGEQDAVELRCDGCDKTIDVEIKKDPTTNIPTPLCFSCLADRTGYAKLVDEK